MSDVQSLIDGQVITELPATADVVIIGGGIVGAATAFWLAKAGRAPVILEREIGLATVTTSSSAHCIRAQFSEPENIAMMSESLGYFERFAELLEVSPEVGDIALQQQGYLFATTEPDERLVFETRVSRQQSMGLADVELLDGEEIRYRWPWLASDISCGAFRQRDGWIDGCKAAALFAHAARTPILFGTTVLEIERSGSRVTGVRTDRGTITTDTVVLSAGPFSGPLAGEPLPISPLRRQRVIVAAHSGIPQHGPMTIDANTGAHWRPHQGGALMAWAQSEPTSDPVFPVPPRPGYVDLILNDCNGVQRLAPFWKELAPSLPADAITTRAGQYTMTPDHKPLIGPANETDGLWINTGYSGHGIMGSPSGGRILADTIAGKLDAADNPFHPGRFDAGSKPPDCEQIVL